MKYIGTCFPLTSNKVFVSIKLMTTIKVKSITLEYPSKKLNYDAFMMDMAYIRDFEVYGYLESDKKHMNNDYLIPLGRFTYEKDNFRIQNFKLTSSIEIDHINIQVLSKLKYLY